MIVIQIKGMNRRFTEEKIEIASTRMKQVQPYWKAWKYKLKQ